MVAVAGGVTAESADLRIHFEASSANLTATIHGISGVAEALRRVRSLAPLARSIVPVLVRLGLTLDVVVGGVRVARAGAGIEADHFARLLKVSNLKIGD